MTVLVPSKDSANEQITNQCRELAVLITRHTHAKGDGFHRTAINRLDFARESALKSSNKFLGKSCRVFWCNVSLPIN